MSDESHSTQSRDSHADSETASILDYYFQSMERPDSATLGPHGTGGPNVSRASQPGLEPVINPVSPSPLSRESVRETQSRQRSDEIFIGFVQPQPAPQFAVELPAEVPPRNLTPAPQFAVELPAEVPPRNLTKAPALLRERRYLQEGLARSELPSGNPLADLPPTPEPGPVPVGEPAYQRLSSDILNPAPPRHPAPPRRNMPVPEANLNPRPSPAPASGGGNPLNPLSAAGREILGRVSGSPGSASAASTASSNSRSHNLQNPARRAR